MGKNSNNKTVIDVWSEDFWKAKDALRGHVLSLAKLAEKTVAEADNIAKEVKKKALAEAEAEANTILAKAEDQAQHMIEEKRLEARAITNKKTEVIKANTRQVKRLCTELMSQLESLKQQMTALQVEIERNLSQLEKQTNPATMEEESNVALSTESWVSSKATEQIHAMDQSETDKLEKETPVSAKKQATIEYEGDVRLEILPPINTGKVNEIMKYLGSVPEIEMTELIPTVGKPSIAVSLREPVQLLKMLKTLPQVSQAFEVKDETSKITIGAGGARSKARHLQIQLWL